MSYLVQNGGREELFAITSEMPIPKRLGDETSDSFSRHRDDDWDHLWTDMGGEA